MDEVEELPPGWYRQQTDPSMLRWWDGHDWTDDVLAAPTAPPVADDRPRAEVRSDDRTAASAPSEPPRRGREQLRSPAGPAGPAEPRRRPVDDGAWRPAAGERDEGPWVRITDDGQIAPGARQARPGPGPRPQGPDRSGARGPSPAPRQGGRPPAGSRASADPRRTTPPRRPPGRSEPGARYASARTGDGPHLGRFAFRILMVAAVAVLAYLLAKPFIEGPDDARTLADEPATATTVGADGTTADGRPPLSEAVLRLSELPSGWSTQAELSGARIGFCGGRNPLGVLVPAEELHATFSQGSNGPFLSSLTARYATADEAELLMDLVAQTFETCRTYDDNGGTVTLEPSDFPGLGDETIAAHIVGTTSLGDLEGDVVWVRRGSRVVTISSIAFGEFDVGLVELLAEAVARRL